jgi:hypothetical protein
MAKKKFPPKWTEVYPQGTREGDEEQRFFISLARHPKYTWRSTAQLAKDAKITPERVEEICNKYLKRKIVMQCPTNVDQWGYWERNKELLEDEDLSIASKDQGERIDKAINPAVTGTGKMGLGNLPPNPTMQKKVVICPFCGGTGQDHYRKCKLCGGRGTTTLGSSTKKQGNLSPYKQKTFWGSTRKQGNLSPYKQTFWGSTRIQP